MQKTGRKLRRTSTVVVSIIPCHPFLFPREGLHARKTRRLCLTAPRKSLDTATPDSPALIGKVCVCAGSSGFTGGSMRFPPTIQCRWPGWLFGISFSLSGGSAPALIPSATHPRRGSQLAAEARSRSKMVRALRVGRPPSSGESAS